MRRRRFLLISPQCLRRRRREETRRREAASVGEEEVEGSLLSLRVVNWLRDVRKDGGWLDGGGSMGTMACQPA